MTHYETPILGRWRAGNPRTIKLVHGNGQGFENITHGCLIEVVLEIGPSEDGLGTTDEVRGHVKLVKPDVGGQPWHSWALFDHEWVSPGLLRMFKLGLETTEKARAALDELEQWTRPIAERWHDWREARRSARDGGR